MRPRERTTFPARFQLVASMSPGPCWACDEAEGIQGCTTEQVEGYRARVARTIAEHLAFIVEMRGCHPSGDTLEVEPTAAVRARGLRAQEVRLRRSGRLSQDTPVEAIRDGGEVSEAAEKFLVQGAGKMDFSQHRCDTRLKVGRTIGDVGGANRIRGRARRRGAEVEACRSQCVMGRGRVTGRDVEEGNGTSCDQTDRFSVFTQEVRGWQ